MKIRIDYFSDTNFAPSKAMREYMMAAEVGNEAANEDPTVNRLIDMVCAMLNKPAGIFLPTGTMSNAIAYKTHVRNTGDYIILDETSHPLIVQSGLIAGLVHATALPIKGINGIFRKSQIEELVARPAVRNIPKVRLVSIEQTTNFGGGAIWPLADIQEIYALCKQHNVLMHLDGARLFNACIASQISVAEYSKYFDSVFVDFSKGLGAPVGSILLGSKKFIERAWYYKFQFGGAMHQSGFLAAGCIYALENNIINLAEDHKKANYLAKNLSNLRNIAINPDLYQTNIVYFSLSNSEISPKKFLASLLQKGIRMVNIGNKIRAITHYGISYSDIDQTLAVINKILSS